MTEPKQPRVVYQPPKQKKPCEKCEHCAGDEWLFCDRPIKPEELSTSHEVNPFGTCGYWEINTR